MNILMKTGSLTILFVMAMTTKKPFVRGVREGAANRNIRPTRKPISANGDSGGITSLGMAILIPCVILIFFFVLLCCCIRMKSKKREPAETEEEEVPATSNLPANSSEPDFFSGYQQPPPSYNSLSDMADDDTPPPTYEDFITTQKPNLFMRMFNMGTSRPNSRRPSRVSTISMNAINELSPDDRTTSENTTAHNASESNPGQSNRNSEENCIDIPPTIVENAHENCINIPPTIPENPNENSLQNASENRGQINEGYVPSAEELHRDGCSRVEHVQIENGHLTIENTRDNRELEPSVSVITTL